MKVHLVDGTYELFRHFYSPAGGHTNAAGEEVGATRGVLRTVIGMLEDGVTHVGVATDHVIESFRNDMWADYKDGSGIDPDLFTQFPWLEDALRALGVTVWAMVEVEADDALAAAAAVADSNPAVERVVIATPDKDLAQCVRGDRVVQYDRRAGQFRDAAGVEEKYGVPPKSIPDWLALVGDSADGFPGLPGWGAKSAAKVLSRYGTIEQIPHAPGQWDVPGVRGAAKLAATLSQEFESALLFKKLAILVTDVDVGAVEDWRWSGPTTDLERWCDRLDAADVLRKASAIAANRA
jgi:5'-3' exonuclease